MKIISVANQKGGVAKTTTSVNVAVALAQKGNRVCIMDLDPQGNVALSFGYRPKSLEKTILTAFNGECEPKEIVLKTHYKVDILPSNRGLEIFTLLVEQNKKNHSPAFWAKELLDEFKDRYDYVIIDNPPSLDWLTINGLSTSDYLIIPMPPEIFAEAGVADLIDTYKKVKKSYNRKLEILGVVMTLYSPIRTNLATIVSQDINKFCYMNDIRVFDTVIKRSTRFGEAVAHKQPAIVYARGNEAVQDYIKLTEELLAHV